MSNIYLVQHCQSEHHVNELTGGWTDTPLTDLGMKQVTTVVNELNCLKLNEFELITSDLKRAYMTAEFISTEFSTKIVIDRRLREINNGIAANQTKAWANNNRLYDTNGIDIDKPLWTDAETPRELYNRVSSFIEDKLHDTDKDVVIVSHGIAIGYLISSWLGIKVEQLGSSFIKGNAGGVSCLTVNQLGQRTLTLFNTTSHLWGLE